MKMTMRWHRRENLILLIREDGPHIVWNGKYAREGLPMGHPYFIELPFVIKM